MPNSWLARGKCLLCMIWGIRREVAENCARLNHTKSTGWFKYDRDYLCVNKPVTVPVIFEPPFILIRSNEMQQYAGIYLLQNHSTCFGCTSQPSSGIHKTVTAASGTGHSIWATTFHQRGQWPRWRKIVAQILWPVPEAIVTVLCTPDYGCNGYPNHVEWFYSK